MNSDQYKVPERFKVAKKTLIIDKAMNTTIKIGGLGVVISVLGIFLFILWQIVPLLTGASVNLQGKVETKIEDEVIAIGSDEWSELPVYITKDGKFYFIDRKNNDEILQENPLEELSIQPTAVTFSQEVNKFAFGTADGKVILGSIEYDTEFSDGEKRKVVYAIHLDDPIQLGEKKPIDQVEIGIGENKRLIAALQGKGTASPQIHILQLEEAGGLFGDGGLEVIGEYKLSDQLKGSPKIIIVAKTGEYLAVADEEGNFYYFTVSDFGIALEQELSPFDGEKIASLGFIFGDVSISATSISGKNVILSLYAHKEQNNKRLFDVIHAMDDLPTADSYFFAKSRRNKAYLIGTGQTASLRFSTTEKTLWEKNLGFAPNHALITGKYDGLIFVDSANNLYQYSLDNPHPESSLKGFFGKVWYEGASKPKFEWQSSSANEDFEPKLSMIPLIWGSIKGTFFALLFAIPIALLAAIYVSQFLEPKFKNIIKPTMEIMGSIPSVVLGFLGALYVAPLIEDKFPSILFILFLVPIMVLLIGTIWSNQPYTIRRKIKPGFEYIVFAPILIGLVYLGWECGPILEKIFFMVDEGDGVKVADFRLWFQTVIGGTYEQRNSLVIGFMMGFAVMPIIFTISEDALSNVPNAFKSGAFALGASRWQVAYKIILPTATAGIFSAVMIGFGRAIGETMIVVMATGNTPIIDFNVFTGMRTLSANIAVELPEAPQGGTLYRALYLGAFLLFVMTFLINTASEVLRQRFRKRFSA